MNQDAQASWLTTSASLLEQWWLALLAAGLLLALLRAADRVEPSRSLGEAYRSFIALGAPSSSLLAYLVSARWWDSLPVLPGRPLGRFVDAIASIGLVDAEVPTSSVVRLAFLFLAIFWTLQWAWRQFLWKLPIVGEPSLNFSGSWRVTSTFDRPNSLRIEQAGGKLVARFESERDHRGLGGDQWDVLSRNGFPLEPTGTSTNVWTGPIYPTYGDRQRQRTGVVEIMQDPVVGVKLYGWVNPLGTDQLPPTYGYRPLSTYASAPSYPHSPSLPNSGKRPQWDNDPAPTQPTPTRELWIAYNNVNQDPGRVRGYGLEVFIVKLPQSRWRRPALMTTYFGHCPNGSDENPTYGESEYVRIPSCWEKWIVWPMLGDPTEPLRDEGQASPERGWIARFMLSGAIGAGSTFLLSMLGTIGLLLALWTPPSAPSPTDPSPPPHTRHESRPEATQRAVGSEALRLPSMAFDVGSHRLTAQGRETLTGVTKSLRDLRVQFVVEGHTDERGGTVANEGLSYQRAASVRDALVAQGVPPSRICIRGMGETEPVASNATEEGRGLNRRVEIRVLHLPSEGPN